jgi:hypothetical protein
MNLHRRRLDASQRAMAGRKSLLSAAGACFVPGFCGGRLSALAAVSLGAIVDMLIWDSAEAGRKAASGIMTEMGRSRVHGMIDQSDTTRAPRP